MRSEKLCLPLGSYPLYACDLTYTMMGAGTETRLSSSPQDRTPRRRRPAEAQFAVLRPRMRSAPFSAIAIVAANVFAEGSSGMMEASMTRKFCTPWTNRLFDRGHMQSIGDEWREAQACTITVHPDDASSRPTFHVSTGLNLNICYIYCHMHRLL